MKQWLINYFTIPRKERIGIVALLCLISLVWLIPYLWRVAIKADAEFYYAKAGSIDPPLANASKRLHDFDPNTIDDNEWLSLGVSEHTVKTIRNYLNKGGQFRKPEALMTIYGLDTNIARSLVPYVKIKQAVHAPKQPYEKINLNVESIDPKFRKPAQKTILMVDINTTDSAALESLPWIGEKTASRIIKYRDACGGFYHIDQIAGIYGVSDTAFLHFRTFLRIGKKDIKQLNINTDPLDSLAKHPYMQYKYAKALVSYRDQHGSFKSSQDILAIPLFDKQWLERIEPYLRF